MTFTATIADYKTQLLMLKIQEAVGPPDNSPYWTRPEIILTLERTIATYERLDKQAKQAILQPPKQ